MVTASPSRTPRIVYERRKLIPISPRKNRAPEEYYTCPPSPKPTTIKKATQPAQSLPAPQDSAVELFINLDKIVHKMHKQKPSHQHQHQRTKLSPPQQQLVGEEAPPPQTPEQRFWYKVMTK